MLVEADMLDAARPLYPRMYANMRISAQLTAGSLISVGRRQRHLLITFAKRDAQ
jgi:hypothetical protein